MSFLGVLCMSSFMMGIWSFFAVKVLKWKRFLNEQKDLRLRSKGHYPKPYEKYDYQIESMLTLRNWSFKLGGVILILYLIKAVFTT